MTANKLFILLIPILFSLSLAGQSKQSEFIYYDSDEYVLDDGDKEQLQSLVKEITSHSDF